MKNKKYGIRIVMLFIAVFTLAGCGKKEKKNPTIAGNAKLFYEAWDKAALDNIDTKDIRYKLATTYPEELNMETHNGLVKPEDFTGPILCFRSNESNNHLNRIYIPNKNMQDYIKKTDVPRNF